MLNKTSSHISNIAINLCGEELLLNADKSIYWPRIKTIIISDLHIGKIMHFRKNGYAVPPAALKKNIERIFDAFLNVDVAQCVFLGDLYHSCENSETDFFWETLESIEGVQFHLVKGNHDVHSNLYFEKKGLRVSDSLELGPFLMTHEPLTEPHALYNLAGHIHPAIKLRGKAKSSLRLPCFYFSDWQGILPAFGVFTGTHTISPKEGDAIYAVSKDGAVIKL